jgi:hypothetical protein
MPEAELHNTRANRCGTNRSRDRQGAVAGAISSRERRTRLQTPYRAATKESRGCYRHAPFATIFGSALNLIEVAFPGQTRMQHEVSYQGTASAIPPTAILAATIGSGCRYHSEALAAILDSAVNLGEITFAWRSATKQQALYQGTASAVPPPALLPWALAPVRRPGAEAHHANSVPAWLKPCPDTRRPISTFTTSVEDDLIPQ